MKKALKVSGIQAHMSPTRHVDKSIDCCKKDGDWVDFGTPPTVANLGTTSGRRDDLNPFEEAAKSGILDKKLLQEQFSSVAASHTQFFEQCIADDRPKVAVESHPLRPWQQSLRERLRLHPESEKDWKRQIAFAVDGVGNQGKSWFVDHCESLHEKTLR